MNKFRYFAIVFFFLLSSSLSYAQGELFFSEDFESGTQPDGWTYEYVISFYDWEFQDGGFSTNISIPGSGHPPYAYQGVYNAMFHVQNLGNETTKFITPPIDLSYGIKPELAFWHAQDERYTFGDFRNDELRVYVKKGENQSWVKILEVLETVDSWTQRNIFIADSLLSDSVYIAFEGKTNNGWGTCIDSITIIEKGIIPRYVESVTIQQASTEFVPTESQKNAILRIDFSIKGNEGTLILDSMAVKSLNTDDNDISINGVKLYYSNDTLFQNSTQLGSGTNFQSSIATFNNLNRSFPTGLSSIWITYDIIIDSNHELHEHTLDALIEDESILVNGYLYPSIDKSPEGSRTIYEALLYDNFETDKGWILTGEFQRTTPLGKGGSVSNSDPEEASSGVTVLGTDLTGLGSYPGDYEFNLTDRAYTATSPYLDCKYYKDLYLYFDRWLNIDGNDTVTIDMSAVTKNNWQKFWQNSGTSITGHWSPLRYNISSVANRKDSVQIRYTLGPTNDFWNFSGWNIDDVVVVGNFISKDVGVTNWIGPLDGCGHTDEEYVEITIKNYAGEAMTDPLPVSYSFDGGTTIKYDTIYATIPIDGSITYTIDKPIDLTTPGWYNNVYATTHLAGDEDAANNKLNTIIFIAPTYTLPYSQNFETNYGYYRVRGINSKWQYGSPAGFLINSAASGSKAWVTNLTGNYLNNDSSFLESPCFNFSGTDSIIFEFKCKGISEEQTDGLSLMYSLDEGANWSLVPNDHDFYWNWYNETNITELELPGIDTTSGQWLTFRQLLPPAFSNQSSVKFRFIFESNENDNYEGFGIDDVKIYEAPADVGVISIDEPITQCELSDVTQVKVTIGNFGITTLDSGSKIPVGFDFHGSFLTKDTLELTAPLGPGETVPFTFLETLEMSNAGDYDIAAYTLLESDPYFYNETICNDTISETVTVQGMPNYNPFPVFIGVDAGQPINVVLNAQAGYDEYLWSPVGHNDYDTTITSTGIYKVTVTKYASPSNCLAEDSVEIIGSTTDITINSILTSLADSCEITERTELTELSINLTNNGLADLTAVDDTIFLAYRINELPMIEDTLVNPNLIQTASTDFTFSQKCDLRSSGEYIIKVFHNFSKDLNPLDDTVTTPIINTWKFPKVNLAIDTIYSSQADTLTLDAGSGFASYLWNPGDSTTQTITPINSSFYYKVTVTDVHACGSDMDSTYIETHDLGINEVFSPVNICEDFASATTALNIEIKNYSDNIYSSENTKLFYEYDEGPSIEVNPILNVGASGVVTLNNISTIDATDIGEHSLKIYTSSEIDANHNNDTLEYTFSTWPEPHVNLAYDTIFTTQADTVILVAQEGFVSYAWSDGSTTNDSLIVTNKSSKEYRVTVTDAHCGNDTDSTQIITYNLGVIDFLAPANACAHSNTESVRITIKNFSQDTLVNGTSIPVGYILDGTHVSETLILSSDLNPSQTINYTFSTKANVAAIASYNFKLFTDFKLDVNHNNDTLVDVIKTFGYPSIEIGDDIYTSEPETLTLAAPSGYNFYKWNDGTTTNTLDVSYPATKLYSVTVTDINGCTANDQLTVYTYDVGIASINTPSTTCEFVNNEVLNISVLNNSEDTLLASETIFVSYSLNGSTSVNEIITLAADFLPGTTVDYSFTSMLDLTTATTHNIEVSCVYPNDVNVANDNLSVDIDAVGYPSFSLGEDIYTTNPVGTVLSAPGGYASYEWQDASTNSTFTISNPASAQYAVTVTDAYGCEGSDVIEVYTYNIAATELIAPVSQCELSSSETVSITIMNNSQDLLLSGETINASYTLNSGTPVVESFNLSSNLLPGAAVNYTFTQPADLSANQTHEFELFAELASIDVETNDAITRQVIYQKPILDLGPDVNTGNTEYTINAGAGYSSYAWFDGTTITQTYTVDINDQNPSNKYWVTVTNSYGCSDADTIQVTFTTTPDLAVTSMTSPVSDCWNEEETYPVHIIITNSGVVNLNPGASFTVGYRVDGGTAKTETFNLSAAMDAGDTREHTFADEISFSSAKVYKFKPFVKLADDGNVSNDTLTTGTNIDISAPEVILGANDTISFTSATYEISTSESYLTYLWTGGSTESTLVISETGSYSVTVTDQYGCQGVGSIYCKKITTGIDHVIQGDGYQISYYPNPASEKLMIQIDNQKSTDIIIEIVSSSGQILYNNKLSKIENSLEQIDVSPFTRGVYYFKFKINDEVFIRKIILQ
ncbi:MAG TPA: hypothetical protein DCG75_16945 [Bacteroidales bacterium]|nr:hypothetical protein [Bacteroidales bacterium]